jgi:hypothetical protein
MTCGHTAFRHSAKDFFATECFYQINKLPPSRGDQYPQKDEREPIVLLISAQKLPVEKWESESFLLLPSPVLFLGTPARHAEVQT